MLKTLDFGLWTLDFGLWTLDLALGTWHLARITWHIFLPAIPDSLPKNAIGLLEILFDASGFKPPGVSFFPAALCLPGPGLSDSCRHTSLGFADLPIFCGSRELI
jgi:hypothetical protein